MNHTALKIAFAGTPDIAAEVLTSLIAAGHQIVVSYCQPDRKVGRGKKLAIGPVKQVAIEHNIPVEQPLKFDQSVNEGGLTPQQQLASYDVDLMIVIAYGLLLPQSVLDTPRFGCINIHASILPRWRGAAPIQRAIEAGDTETGITIMQMDKGLDTGNMLLKKAYKIDQNETGSSLHDRLSILGSTGIIEYLKSVDWYNEKERRSTDENRVGESQNEKLSNYANKLSKNEAKVDWRRPALEIERQIRAFNAWPVSFTYLGKNRIRLWKAKVCETKPNVGNKINLTDAGAIIIENKKHLKVYCGNGDLIEILELQADGSKKMSVSEFLNGKGHWFESEPKFSEQ